MPKTDRLDMLMIYPPVTLGGRYGEIATGHEVPPQPFIYLGAVLQEAGFSCQVLDANVLGLSAEQVVERILEIDPLVIGMTAPTMLIAVSGWISQRVKEQSSDITTVVGGPHMSAIPEETMERYPGIEYGVVGEGEVTVVEFMRMIKHKDRQAQDIKGLIFRENGVLCRTEQRPFIEDLDTLPFPAFDLLPDITTNYQQSVARVDRLPAISMTTSRGCPYQCAFCARNVFGNKVRTHGTDYIMKVIKYLIDRYQVKSLCIEDENFTVFKKRLVELCNRLIDEKLDITWSCASGINEISPEILALMKKAGCWQINYGIESGSQRVLDFIKKPNTLDKVRKVLSQTRKVGIMSKGYFMIGHPTETKESIQETIEFARTIDLDDFQMSCVVPFPGTDIYKTAHEYGEFKNDWDNMNIWTPLFIPNGLTEEDLISESKRAFRAFYFRPRPIFRFIKRALRPRYMAKYFKDGLKIFKFLLKRD